MRARDVRLARSLPLAGLHDRLDQRFRLLNRAAAPRWRATIFYVLLALMVGTQIFDNWLDKHSARRLPRVASTWCVRHLGACHQPIRAGGSRRSIPVTRSARVRAPMLRGPITLREDRDGQIRTPTKTPPEPLPDHPARKDRDIRLDC
jgi:hypothetical protein